AYSNTTNSSNDLHIDNFKVRVPPACPEPSALVSSNIAATSATLNWTEGGTATSWQVEYDISTFTQGTGTKIVTGSKPYSLTGLTANTTYKYYVRAICGVGDTSAWSAVSANFMTPLAPPYTQDFATYPTAATPTWTEAAGALGSPTTFSSTTTSNWIADGFGNNGTTGAARVNITGTATDEWLLTPSIDLGSSGAYQMEFDLAYTASGNTNAPATTGTDDVFAVIISTDNGTTWTSANVLKQWDNAGSPNVLNNVSTTGQKIIISLATYTGVVKIAFYAYSNTTNSSNDLHIDNFKVRVPPTCPDPSALVSSNITSTTAALAWTIGGSETTWDIEYGVTGFTQGAGTMITATTTNPHSLSGLTANTTYQFYVRANCGGGDLSDWVGPYSFTTACAVIATFPYTETFEAANTCWTTSAVSGTVLWVRDPSGGSGDISASHGGTGFMEKDYNTSNALLFSEAFDMTALGSDGRVKFWLHRHADAHADDQYLVFVNTTNSLTGATQLLSLYSKTTTAPTVASTGWYEYVLNIPNTFNTSNNVYIIFQGITTAGLSSYDLGVDDFVFEAVPAGPPNCSVITSPANAATNIAVTTNLSWAANVDATGYKLSIGTTTGGTDILNASDLGNVLTYNPPADLAFNTTYYVTLIAYNGNGDATGCTETTFTTNTGCVTPTSPTNGSTTASTSPTISWSSVTGATGYIVSIGTTAGGTDILNAFDNGTATTYAASGLSYTTQYFCFYQSKKMQMVQLRLLVMFIISRQVQIQTLVAVLTEQILIK
ncbi:MAG: hypothetical protein HC803_08445, partial [Saprospiraceae bacterium]|nr:hypothetical protein [Saprospiraceae bacterium]